MGRPGDEEICRQIILEHLPQAHIHVPGTPSFGAAVQYLWSKMSGNVCLHMEDDWLCLDDVEPDRIFPHFADPQMGMVYLAHKQRTPDQTNPRKRLKKTKIWRITVRREFVNDWGTSPRFMSGEAARRYASVLDPEKDPEKQVYRQTNKALCQLQEQYKTFGVWGEGGAPLLQDIGREYREDHGFKKVDMPDGKVHWEYSTQST